jgi:hypothetical protein
MIAATENVLNEFEETASPFASFKDRAFALLIDGLVLLPVTAVMWFDNSNTMG